MRDNILKYEFSITLQLEKNLDDQFHLELFDPANASERKHIRALQYLFNSELAHPCSLLASAIPI